MLVNEHVAVWSSDVVLVPYSAHHVPKYHEWMKDSEIQQLTASEPLSIDEEYEMQQSWRKDADKLTFIVGTNVATTNVCPPSIRGNEGYKMTGDVNLFVCQDYDSENDKEVLTGEIELMIAEREMQGKGLGRASLLLFLAYILTNEGAILDEYHKEHAIEPKRHRLDYFRVKIGKDNIRSRKLFETLGFEQVGKESFFGEVELRRTFTLKDIDALQEKYSRERGREIQYEDIEP